MSASSDNRKSYNASQRSNDFKGGGSGGKKKSVNLPDGYLEGGYYKDPEKKILKPEYIVKYPKELANNFNPNGGNKKSGNKRGENNINKRSQIRKYYDCLLQIDNRMKNSNNDFSLVEADLLGLIPKVNYAQDRGVVTENFKQFIERNVRAVKDEKDLKAFVRHFESVVAFLGKDG